MAVLKFKQSTKTASWLIRIGLAAVLIYAAISSFVSPDAWVGYLPHFLTNHLAAKPLLHGFSVYELLLALWLLSGFYLRYAAALTALTFIGIILANLNSMIITFRDIAIVFSALALIFLDS